MLHLQGNMSSLVREVLFCRVAMTLLDRSHQVAVLQGPRDQHTWPEVLTMSKRGEGRVGVWGYHGLSWCL